MRVLGLVFLLLVSTCVFAQKSADLPDSAKELIPASYSIDDVVHTDLNKDGVQDLIVVATDASGRDGKLSTDVNVLRENRGGIVVAFGKDGVYESVVRNLALFPPVDDYGAYPPELWVFSKRGNLYISFEHGRYGFWRYNFRYQNGDFELIGFDRHELDGPLIVAETSINFLSQKLLVRENQNKDPYSIDDVFIETWKRFDFPKLLTLSEIEDFGGLDIEELLGSLRPVE